MMAQKGDHTWDLVVHYHRCPRCGFIIESRKNFTVQSDKKVKELDCNRCHHHFSVTKAIKPSFGPLFGERQPTEVDWS